LFCFCKDILGTTFKYVYVFGNAWKNTFNWHTLLASASLVLKACMWGKSLPNVLVWLCNSATYVATNNYEEATFPIQTLSKIHCITYSVDLVAGATWYS